MSDENQSDRDNHSLSESLFASLKSPSLQLVGINYEAIIDTLILENDLVKAIPVCASVVSIAKFVGNVTNDLYLKKILRFLNCCSSIPQPELEKFINEIESYPKEKQKVAESLLLLLDKFEQFEKSDALAKVFGAYVRGKITREEFEHYGYALNNINIKNIKLLRSFYDEEEPQINKDLLIGFQAVGLLGQSSINWGNAFMGLPHNFEKNDLGKKFLEIISETSN